MGKPMETTEMVNITQPYEPSYYAALPPVFDWRSQNKVTPVKSQGKYLIY